MVGSSEQVVQVRFQLRVEFLRIHPDKQAASDLAGETAPSREGEGIIQIAVTGSTIVTSSYAAAHQRLDGRVEPGTDTSTLRPTCVLRSGCSATEFGPPG